MKFSFTIICLLVFNCFSVFASDEPEVKLTTEIVSQRYCKGDAELDAIDLNLKLRFENIGNQKIILYRNSEEIDQLIVRENRGEVAGDYEISSMVTWLMSGEWKVGESDLNKTFIVLPPKGTYETQTSAARIFVSREGIDKIAGAVGNGEHFLQIRVSTWYGSRELADNLRNTWKQSGYLWTNSILSLPMKFKVDANRKVVRCE